eukprot:Skav208045  [mRNA]  locus=scaffold1124:6622:8034:- [translate_table: standard]
MAASLVGFGSPDRRSLPAMAALGMSRRPRRLDPAKPLPCLVQLLCLTCLVACGALSQPSFVQGTWWSGRRNVKRQVTERFGKRRGKLPNVPVEEDDARASSVERTSRIKNAPSAKALIEVLDEILDGPFDFYQASSSYHSLATWKRRRSLQRSDWDSPVIARLHARVRDMVLQDELGARELANVLWSIATLSDRFSIPTELFDALVKSLPVKAEGMKPQELSNCLWACAQLKEVVPDVLQIVPAIVAQIIRKAKDMVSQALSNCLWASAQLKEVAPEVLQVVPAITDQITDKAKYMVPQALSNCLWACAQLKDDAPEVLEIVPALLVEVSKKIEDMNAQDLSNNLEALVLLHELVPEIARLVADSDGQEDILRSSAARFSILVPRLRGKDLSIAVPSMISACAKLGLYHEELLLSVAQHLGSRKKLSILSRFNLRSLAWSYEVLDAQHDFEEFRYLLKTQMEKKGFAEED